MLWLYRNSSLVASLFDVNAMVRIADKHKKPVHLQLHQAKNEQPEGEKLQDRAA